MLFNVFSDAEKFSDLLKVMLTGILPTVRIFGFTILLSIPLGILLAAGRVSKVKILRMPISVYIYLIRSTPLMLQLLFFYFGLPYIPVIGPHLAMGRFTTACVAFTLNYAAYFCEIFRGGIKSIDRGQYEAAQVLGLSKVSTLVKIILPQMIRVAIPAVCNEAVNLVKDTALVTTLGVADLMHMTKSQVNSLSNVMPFGIAAVIYMIIIFGLTKLFAYIERKTTY